MVLCIPFHAGGGCQDGEESGGIHGDEGAMPQGVAFFQCGKGKVPGPGKIPSPEGNERDGCFQQGAGEGGFVGDELQPATVDAFYLGEGIWPEDAQRPRVHDEGVQEFGIAQVTRQGEGSRIGIGGAFAIPGKEVGPCPFEKEFGLDGWPEGMMGGAGKEMPSLLEISTEKRVGGQFGANFLTQGSVLGHVKGEM